ncbi:MAG: putative toxin-antitoxin system toxin component, PIN family [Spirochaetes bacterium]|nr:putative toxin-antitoxin system toxin component, PIN family [Spirochaetota bacterium]
MKNKLKVVLDTNILLVSISDRSEFYPIFKAIRDNKIDIAVSNDILLEYEEIISKKMGHDIAEEVIRALIFLPSIHKTTPYFHWQLIDKDKDDNKFVDCVVAANADYLVTNDKHFDILKNIDFPNIKVINIDEFMELLIS